MHRIMDHASMWLTLRQKKCLQQSAFQFQQAYQWLRNKAIHSRRSGWSIRPKLHYLCHLMDELDLIHLNPKVHSCWNSEKFLGKMKQFIKSTYNPRHASLRALQRYKAFLAVRFKRKKLGVLTRKLKKRKNKLTKPGACPALTKPGACHALTQPGACPAHSPGFAPHSQSPWQAQPANDRNPSSSPNTKVHSAWKRQAFGGFRFSLPFPRFRGM